jgi:midasin
LAQIADVVKDKQNIFIENNFLRVGNVAVECNIRSQNYVERGEQDSFHFTTIHAKVMRSMVAAQIHKEPVLLVGSTGSGKTSLVQKFASLMNQNISVYNFNDQSESCDLIGRIVQQDLSSLIGNFNETLTNLIQETTLMKESQKKDLCANIVLLYSLGEWKRYLSFVRNVTGRVQKNLVETKNL